MTDCRLIPETRQDNYLLDHHETTLHRFLLFQDAVLHGLIIRQPYTSSFFSDAVLHGLNIRQPYTGSFFQPTKLQFNKHFQMASLSPSPQLSITSPDGIYKPIPDKILSHFQMASISPSSYPSALQMAFVNPFPPSHF